MDVLEVNVVEYTNEKGYKVNYLTEVKTGIRRRRTVYFNNGVLSKDIDIDVLDKIKTEIKHYNNKRKLFKEQ